MNISSGLFQYDSFGSSFIQTNIDGGIKYTMRALAQGCDILNGSLDQNQNLLILSDGSSVNLANGNYMPAMAMPGAAAMPPMAMPGAAMPPMAMPGASAMPSMAMPGAAAAMPPMVMPVLLLCLMGGVALFMVH